MQNLDFRRQFSNIDIAHDGIQIPTFDVAGRNENISD